MFLFSLSLYLYLAVPANIKVGLCYLLNSQISCFVWRPNSVYCLPSRKHKEKKAQFLSAKHKTFF
jgi:hypothetical protein